MQWNKNPLVCGHPAGHGQRCDAGWHSGMAVAQGRGSCLPQSSGSLFRETPWKVLTVTHTSGSPGSGTTGSHAGPSAQHLGPLHLQQAHFVLLCYANPVPAASLGGSRLWPKGGCTFILTLCHNGAGESRLQGARAVCQGSRGCLGGPEAPAGLRG